MASRKEGREGRSDKKRRSAADVDDGSGLVQQKLSEQELKDRNEELISWLVKDQTVKLKKSQAVAKFNADLKVSGERIKVLTRELDTGIAFVEAQLDLPGTEGGGEAGNDSEAEAS